MARRRKFWVTKEDYILRRIIQNYRRKRNREKRWAFLITQNKCQRKRHTLFVNIFFPKLLRIMVSGMNEKETNKAVKQQSIESLNEAGFKTPALNKDGSINKKRIKRKQQSY